MLRQISKRVDFLGNEVLCEEASSIPVIVFKLNRHILKGCPTDWTEDVKKANWLTAVPEIEYEEDCVVLESDNEYDDELNLVKKRRLH
jgi:hypothetical protein